MRAKNDARIRKKRKNPIMRYYSNHRQRLLDESADTIRENEYRRSVKMKQSTQMTLPFIDVYNGCLVMRDGTYTKIFEVNPTNFSLKPAREQDLIISKIESLLRICPDKIRFKAISRQTNIERFVEDLKKDMRNEKYEKALIRHADQIKLVQEVSLKASVAHRFFCIITLDPRVEKTVSSKVEDCTNQLNRQCQDVIDAFADAGNEVNEIDPGQEDYTVCEILYSLLNVNKAETESYSSHAASILKKYCREANRPLIDPPYIPAVEMVAPKYIDLKAADHYVIDGRYYMVGYIPSNQYPPAVVSGWIDWLVNYGEGVDIDIFMEKKPKEEVLPKLKRAITHNRMTMKSEQDTTDNYGVAADAVATSTYFFENLKGSRCSFLNLCIMITVSSNSLEETREIFRTLKKDMMTNDMGLVQALYHTEDAFLSSMPFGWISPCFFNKARQNMLSRDAASAYPFTSYSLCDKNGIFLGVNTQNDTTTLLDFFDTDKYRNANMSILGSTGSGKTFLEECIANRMRLKQLQVFVLIPKKGMSFKPGCDALGGQYILYSGASKFRINLMEIRKPKDFTTRLLYGDEVIQSLLAQKVQSIKIALGLYIKDLSREEEQLLEKAIVRTYAKFGITMDNESLTDPEHPDRFKKMPILEDLYNELHADEQTKRIATIMYPLIFGSAAAFNGQTNVDLDNLYLVFDLDSLSDELLPIGMFIILDYMWDRVKEDKLKRKVIILDELWSLIGASTSDVAASFVLEIFKLIREYSGSAICATQDIGDFFAFQDGKYGKAIINACKFKMVLGLEEDEAKAVQGVLGLEDNEVKMVTSFRKGKGLICVNNNNVGLNIVASDSELELFSTDTKVMAKVAEKKRRQKNMVV